MAEKKLDIRVKALDDASSTFTQIKENYEGFLHKLRAEGGRRGVLGETAELFEGKGALVGISQVGREVKEATEKFARLNEEIHAGGKSAGEITEGIAKGLPVIGSWVEAGRTIRGILDGTAEEEAAITAENKRINELITFRKKEVAEELASHEAILKAVQKINAERALLNAGQAKGTLGVGQSLAEQRRSAEEEKKKVEKELQEKYAASISAAQGAASQAASQAGEAANAADESRQSSFWTGQASQEDRNAADVAAHSAQANAEAKAKAAGNLIKERDEAIAAAKKDLASRLAAQEDLAGDKLNEIREKQDAKALAEETRANDRIAQVQAGTKQALLGNARKFYEAESEAARAAHAEKSAAIDREARAATEEDPGYAGGIEARRKIAQSAEAGRYAAGKAKIDTDQAQRAEQLDARVSAARIAGLQAQADAEAKVGLHTHALELEQANVQERYAQRKKELLDLDKEGELTAEQHLAIQRQITGLGLQQATAREAAKSEHAKGIRDTLEEARSEALREQAALGDRAADIELKRLNVAKQLRQEMEQLNAVLRDPNASAADKAAARATEAKLRASAAIASGRAGAEGFNLTGSFNAGESYGSGAAAAARERAGLRSHGLPDASSNQEKANGKALAQIESHLAQLVAAAAAKAAVGIGLRW